MRDEGLHVARRTDPRQGYLDRNADHQRAEPVELRVLAPMSRMARR